MQTEMSNVQNERFIEFCVRLILAVTWEQQPVSIKVIYRIHSHQHWIWFGIKFNGCMYGQFIYNNHDQKDLVYYYQEN